MMSPLSGKRVVNSRAAHQSNELSSLLRARGAFPLEYPCIAIAPPRDSAPLDRALAGLRAGDYDWLLLTSANTVEALAQGAIGPLPPQVRVAAVGPATAASARRRLGIAVQFIPATFDAAALAASLPVEHGARALLPESEIARPTLAERLAARGASVTVVPAYRTVRGSGGVDLPALICGKAVDALAFTSSSTVTYFLERMAREGGDPDVALETIAACIGGRTAETARALGFSRLVVAEESTLAGMVRALERHFEREQRAEHET